MNTAKNRSTSNSSKEWGLSRAIQRVRTYADKNPDRLISMAALLFSIGSLVYAHDANTVSTAAYFQSAAQNHYGYILEAKLRAAHIDCIYTRLGVPESDERKATSNDLENLIAKFEDFESFSKGNDADRIGQYARALEMGRYRITFDYLTALTQLRVEAGDDPELSVAEETCRAFALEEGGA